VVKAESSKLMLAMMAGKTQPLQDWRQLTTTNSRTLWQIRSNAGTVMKRCKKRNKRHGIHSGVILLPGAPSDAT
jgi:hypothetical protein